MFSFFCELLFIVKVTSDKLSYFKTSLDATIFSLSPLNFVMVVFGLHCLVSLCTLFQLPTMAETGQKVYCGGGWC